MYGHGLGAIVLCEAYGMTHDKILERPAQGSINFIVEALQMRVHEFNQLTPPGSWVDTTGVPLVGGWPLSVDVEMVIAARTRDDQGNHPPIRLALASPAVGNAVCVPFNSPPSPVCTTKDRVRRMVFRTTIQLKNSATARVQP